MERYVEKSEDFLQHFDIFRGRYNYALVSTATETFKSIAIY